MVADKAHYLSYEITGHTETYTSTPDHPFYVAGQGWLTAGTLTKGTAIATRSGMALIVTARSALE